MVSLLTSSPGRTDDVTVNCVVSALDPGERGDIFLVDCRGAEADVGKGCFANHMLWIMLYRLGRDRMFTGRERITFLRVLSLR